MDGADAAPLERLVSQRTMPFTPSRANSCQPQVSQGTVRVCERVSA